LPRVIPLYERITTGHDRLSAAAKVLGSPEIAVPRHIRTISEIPLLGSGKVDYVRLKELAGVADESGGSQR
jgi:acyl-[acyl-carrier-protein]-phospholipid O-acyltransferase/long-chain-fatty-acid--[acyl-carrier-protein] ligase